MPQSLQEYADWLEGRGLIWPKLPPPEKPKAVPYLKPLEGIRAVTWSVYGVLLRIADGKLLHRHPQELRMQVALEKTIEEFHMWHSMSRKPGAPWKYMLSQYAGVLEQQQLRPAKRKGDFPEVNSAHVWRTLIERLVKNGYAWDESMYGDLDDYSVKVAYFFHMRLQGVEVAEQAVAALNGASRAKLVQGLLADAQPFTLTQMLRAFRGQGTLPPLGELFDSECLWLSYQLGVAKPSKSLYEHTVRQLARLGLSPEEVLHVGSRLTGDLAVAKQFGMRTALFAGDSASLEARNDALKDPRQKPDRLLTRLDQIGQILGIA